MHLNFYSLNKYYEVGNEVVRRKRMKWIKFLLILITWSNPMPSVSLISLDFSTQGNFKWKHAEKYTYYNRRGNI